MSRLDRVVSIRSQDEPYDALPTGDGDEVRVPWQVYTVDGDALTVHYFTNATNVQVGATVDEDDAEVRVTVLERRTSRRTPGSHREQHVTLSRPLGGRRVVDPTSGVTRDEFVPDPAVGWARFDELIAQWVLDPRAYSPEGAAKSALADGCEGTALEALAAGGADVAAVYRERGLELPTGRAAAKLIVDATLAESLDPDVEPEWMGGMLAHVSESGRMGDDQREQIDGLIRLRKAIGEALDTTGEAEELMDRFLAEARCLHARGGLRS